MHPRRAPAFRRWSPTEIGHRVPLSQSHLAWSTASPFTVRGPRSAAPLTGPKPLERTRQRGADLDERVPTEPGGNWSPGPAFDRRPSEPARRRPARRRARTSAAASAARSAAAGGPVPGVAPTAPYASTHGRHQAQHRDHHPLPRSSPSRGRPDSASARDRSSPAPPVGRDDARSGALVLRWPGNHWWSVSSVVGFASPASGSWTANASAATCTPGSSRTGRGSRTATGSRRPAVVTARGRRAGRSGRRRPRPPGPVAPGDQPGGLPRGVGAPDLAEQHGHAGQHHGQHVTKAHSATAASTVTMPSSPGSPAPSPGSPGWSRSSELHRQGLVTSEPRPDTTELPVTTA